MSVLLVSVSHLKFFPAQKEQIRDLATRHEVVFAHSREEVSAVALQAEIVVGNTELHLVADAPGLRWIHVSVSRVAGARHPGDKFGGCTCGAHQQACICSASGPNAEHSALGSESGRTEMAGPQGTDVPGAKGRYHGSGGNWYCGPSHSPDCPGIWPAHHRCPPPGAGACGRLCQDA